MKNGLFSQQTATWTDTKTNPDIKTYLPNLTLTNEIIESMLPSKKPRTRDRHKK